MIITYKEFKENVPDWVSVYIGAFRWDKLHKFYGREVDVCGEYIDGKFFRNLPLSDEYKMDVYTDWEDFGLGTVYVHETSDVDFHSERFYVISPTFADDVEKYYYRVNNAKQCSINAQVLASVSEACATWMRLSHYLRDRNKVRFLCGIVLPDACEKDVAQREKAVRHTVRLANRAFQKYLNDYGYSSENAYLNDVKSIITRLYRQFHNRTK
nr:MAG TPA: hypothetical protein [Caudoviricetes sp.]